MLEYRSWGAVEWKVDKDGAYRLNRLTILAPGTPRRVGAVAAHRAAGRADAMIAAGCGWSVLVVACVMAWALSRSILIGLGTAVGIALAGVVAYHWHDLFHRGTWRHVTRQSLLATVDHEIVDVIDQAAEIGAGIDLDPTLRADVGSAFRDVLWYAQEDPFRASGDRIMTLYEACRARLAEAPRPFDEPRRSSKGRSHDSNGPDADDLERDAEIARHLDAAVADAVARLTGPPEA